MKRLFLLLLTVIFTLALIACGESGEAETSAPDGTAAEENTTVSADTSAEETTEAVTTAAAETETDAEETTADTAMLPEGEVRVMSFNLDANEATIKKRSKDIIPMILEQLPDSIGVQECRGTWNRTITKGLEEKYARIGIAADGAKESGSAFATYIFYLKDKYDVIDSGTFWLSTTPNVPSKYNDVVDCNRTCTWAILENKETGVKYAHINSHLDWMDVRATDYQIQMIRRFIEIFDEMGVPAFATGDYNNDEGSATYKLMLAGDDCVVGDSKFIAEKTMSLGTYPSYGEYDVTVEKPIDFCFVTKNRVKVTEYKVIDDKPNGEYMSDHNPLRIDAVILAAENTYKTAEAPEAPKLSTSDVKYNAVSGLIDGDRKGAPVRAYEFWVTDAEGKEVYRESVKLPYMDLGYERGSTAPFRATGLSDGSVYTLHATAENVFGKVSAEATAEVTTTARPQPESAGKADLFELGHEDGGFIDLSDNRSEIITVGTVGTDKTGYLASFTGRGNLKVPAFKEFYPQLEDGFTMEVTVRFGSDVNTFKSIVSNMHAGGFGIGVENGEVSFSVYARSQYIGASAPVKANTEYKVVGVFDGQKVQIYINGDLISETEVGGKVSFATDNGAKYLCIGADSDASGNGEYQITADVKSVKIYSEPLTAAQVAGIDNK